MNKKKLHIILSVLLVTLTLFWVVYLYLGLKKLDVNNAAIMGSRFEDVIESTDFNLKNLSEDRALKSSVGLNVVASTEHILNRWIKYNSLVDNVIVVDLEGGFFAINKEKTSVFDSILFQDYSWEDFLSHSLSDNIGYGLSNINNKKYVFLKRFVEFSDQKTGFLLAFIDVGKLFKNLKDQQRLSDKYAVDIVGKNDVGTCYQESSYIRGNYVCTYLSFSVIFSLIQKDIILIIMSFIVSLLLGVFISSYRTKKNKLKVVSEISQQVAHDIRSPLAALNIVIKELSELSEEKRVLIQQAVQRIDDIASDLADKNYKNSEKEEVCQKKIEVYLISAALESIISEKRTQYRSYLNVDIRADVDDSSYGLFCKINLVEFKRVISNLINNSVEAFGDQKGEIIVSLHAGKEDAIQVTVSDNGKGIPQNLINKITERGFTSGKKTGSGLGLFHAKASMEKWGGSLEVSSQKNMGTTITLLLPKQKAPDWFVPKLCLVSKQTLVIVDDDQSIHKIWEGRFLPLTEQANLQIKNFSMPEQVERFVREENDNSIKIYLFDYEFLGSKVNGLDIIEKLGIQKQSVLVTSRYEQKDVRERCAKLGVKLIPKTLAGYVPIEIKKEDSKEENKQENYDCILIDDEAMVRTMWEMIAKQKGKSIKTYSDPKDFFQDIESFHKETTIYIDSNLQDDLKGEEVSKDIYEKGFETIYLATGNSKDMYGDLPWVKDVVGKEPPWG